MIDEIVDAEVSVVARPEIIPAEQAYKEVIIPVKDEQLQNSRLESSWISNAETMTAQDRLLNASSFAQAENTRLASRANSVLESGGLGPVETVSAVQLSGKITEYAERGTRLHPNFDAATGGEVSRGANEKYISDVLEGLAEDALDSLLRESNRNITPELIQARFGFLPTAEQVSDMRYLVEQIKQTIPATELVNHFARLKVLKTLKDMQSHLPFDEIIPEEDVLPSNEESESSESLHDEHEIPAESSIQPIENISDVNEKLSAIDLKKINVEQARRIKEIFSILNSGAEGAVDFARVDQLINLIFDVKGGGTWAAARGTVEGSPESKAEASTLKALDNVFDQEDPKGSEFLTSWLQSMSVNLEKSWGTAIRSRIVDAYDETALNSADRKAEFHKVLAEHLKKFSPKNEEIDFKQIVITQAIESYLVEKAEKLQQKSTPQ